MFFDPLYMAVMIVGALLSFGTQFWVKSRFNRYSQVGLHNTMTGAEVAAAILRAQGVRGVRIEAIGGFFSDHYDPSAKVLRLSPDVFSGRSVAAAGVAAHEVGHAIQDAAGYWPMRMRQKMVPVAGIGSNLGVLLIVAGLFVGLTQLSMVGVMLFGGFVLFTLVTLPVEFDASYRAHKILVESGLVTASESAGVRSVLMAAAATYLASAATAVLQLLYWISVARRD